MATTKTCMPATMATGVDLTGDLSAELKFYATYTIETDFDTMYVEASSNNFAKYARIAYFSHENAPLPALVNIPTPLPDIVATTM